MHDYTPDPMYDPVPDLPDSLPDRIFMGLIYSYISLIILWPFIAVCDRIFPN